MTASRPSLCRGISLIEMIIAMVILGIAGSLATAGLITMARSVSIDEDIQGATRLAQQCSEHILTFRRAQSSSGNRWSQVSTGVSTICDSAANDAAYTRTVTISNPTVATSPDPLIGPCYSYTATDCKVVSVTFAKTLINGVSYSTNVTFMLTRY